MISIFSYKGDLGQNVNTQLFSISENGDMLEAHTGKLPAQTLINVIILK